MEQIKIIIKDGDCDICPECESDLVGQSGEVYQCNECCVTWTVDQI